MRTRLRKRRAETHFHGKRVVSHAVTGRSGTASAQKMRAVDEERLALLLRLHESAGMPLSPYQTRVLAAELQAEVNPQKGFNWKYVQHQSNWLQLTLYMYEIALQGDKLAKSTLVPTFY